MSKYIVKNCPGRFYSEIGDKQKCWQKLEEKSEYCQDCPDCIIKQIIGLCKENQFFHYGAVMLGNGLSVDILDLLEIQEIKEQETE